MAEDSSVCISIDDFQRWKVNDLRKYIRDRGQTNGSKRKDELVAIAFTISQQKLAVVPNKQELKDQVDVDYETLLFVRITGEETVRIPDPLTMDAGWMTESSGVQHWPPCTYVNISEYLVETDQRALLSRLGNDYKEGMCVIMPRLS
jgi:hypothetical protein